MLGQRNPLLLFKLAAVAFFAEVGGGSGSFKMPGRLAHGYPPAHLAALAAFIVFGVFVGLLVALAFFYLSSRLQFVLFHEVLHSETRITPIWHLYGPATWRWIGLKLLYFLVFIVCLAPVLAPAIVIFLRTANHNAAADSSPANFGTFFASILLFVFAVMVFVFVFAVAYILIRDFGLPSMALEATTLRETIRRVIALVRAEPAQVALFIVMRLVLAIAGSLASYLAILFCALMAAVPLGGLAIFAWLMLHHSESGGYVFMILAWCVLGLLFAAILIFVSISLLGYLFTFLQAYVIYFLAGRYPLLGNQLQTVFPTPGPAPAWPPGYYPTPQPPPA
jgi:hypothetical protein